MFFQGNEKYNCATYLRLSRSDGDQQESNSIKNQRALLNDYMGKHPELHKFDEYVDDGYSGTNFERPDFKRMMVAMDQIHHLVSTMCEEEKLVKDMMRGSNLDSTRSIKMKEKSILFRIQEAEERRLRLYEDYKAEILDEDEYSQLKEHYIVEKQRLEHELQKQRQRALELEKRIKICDAQMERMRGILNQKEFDEELVHELIKRIYVGMDNSVEVEFKCSDPYQEVLAIMSEVQNE